MCDVEDIAFCIFLKHTLNNKIFCSYGYELSDLASSCRDEWGIKSAEEKSVYIEQAHVMLSKLEKYFYG